METSTVAPAVTPTERPWAPGVGWMVVHSALMVLCLAVPSQLHYAWQADEGFDRRVMHAVYGGFVLAFGFAIAAHNAYSKARKALQADPTLRGDWLVRNLWWVVLVVLIAPSVLGFGLAMLFFGWMAFG